MNSQHTYINSKGYFMVKNSVLNAVLMISYMQIYPVLYNNWLFLTLFSSLLKDDGEEKENEVAKPVLNHFFFRIDFKLSGR